MKAIRHALLPQRWRFRSWLLLYALRREPLRRRVVRLPLARSALELRQLGGRFRSRPAARGLERLDAIVVINLAERRDRLEGFRASIASIGSPDVTRIEGIRHEIGAVGCARAHIAAIEQMLAHGWSALMICEDDARFAASRAKVDVLVDAFLDDPAADVLCLGYRQERVVRYSRFFLRATATTTRPCYVVKAAVARELYEVWSVAAEKLAAGGDGRLYAGDQAWKQLQGTRTFLISIPRVVYQQSGYSDIRRGIVSYAHEGDSAAVLAGG